MIRLARIYVMVPVNKIYLISLLLCSHSIFAKAIPDSLYQLETLPVTTPIADATIYVAPSGSDETGDGSINNPYSTVHMALAMADSGDVINLREGHYDEPEGVRFRRPGITLQSQPGEWAVIQAPHDDEENAPIALYMDTNAWHTTLRRIEIIGGYYYAVSTETRWDWGDPDDRTGCSHILIEDCTIHDSGRDCIKIKPNCDHITIRGCEIYNSGRIYPPGETDGNAEGIDNVNGDYMLVQDCYIHDTFSTGVYFKGGATQGVVERCRIENCGAAGVLIGFDTSPEYFDLEVNPDYYENMMGMVRNCLIVNTRYAGIGLYAAKGARVLNNTIINAAQEAHAALYFGVTFQDWEPYAGRPASTDAQFYNNLVFIPQESDAPAVSIRYADELGGLSGLEGMPVMDHNLYYHENSAVLFKDNRPGSELESGTLAQWREHIGNETHSLQTDPLLNMEYKPGDGSQTIDNGVTHELVSFDLARNNRISLFDIGAFENQNPTAIKLQETRPDHFQLSVFPNPARDVATVQWQQPEYDTVTLSLYNLLGQKVATLYQDKVTHGIKNFQMSNLHLPAGPYIIQCQTCGCKQSKSIDIVR